MEEFGQPKTFDQKMMKLSNELAATLLFFFQHLLLKEIFKKVNGLEKNLMCLLTNNLHLFYE